MSAPAAVRACTCGHLEDVHTARRPEGACTACTQCDGLLRDHPHDWHRCCCLEFDPATPLGEIYGRQLDKVFEAWAGGLPWIVLHSHTATEPCDDTCSSHPPRGANSEADSTD